MQCHIFIHVWPAMSSSDPYTHLSDEERVCDDPRGGDIRGCQRSQRGLHLQGYLAHKKTPTPLGPPWDPRYWPTVGS